MLLVYQFHQPNAGPGEHTAKELLLFYVVTCMCDAAEGSFLRERACEESECPGTCPYFSTSEDTI